MPDLAIGVLAAAAAAVVIWFFQTTRARTSLMNLETQLANLRQQYAERHDELVKTKALYQHAVETLLSKTQLPPTHRRPDTPIVAARFVDLPQSCRENTSDSTPVTLEGGVRRASSMRRQTRNASV